MARAMLFVFFSFVFLVVSCSKDTYIRSKNAFLILSDTAIHFDTVFTSVGSATKQCKLFNINNQKLHISNIQLMGGAASFFKINVSGTEGPQVENIDIGKGDSLHLFVTVNINPTAVRLPFLIEDSIRIDYNGNTQFIRLDAFGQNAHFLRGTIISENTTWPNDLPYVLLDTFAVSVGAHLTVEKGVHVFCHSNTPFTIAGSLEIDGLADSANRVTFAADRLDAPYNNEPGTWQGIVLAAGSKKNKWQGVIIRNALRGVEINERSELTLSDCIITNCAESGIIASNSAITATNCLITNNSYNIYAGAGGLYSFTNCTVAGYNTPYLYHQYPSVTLANVNDDGSAAAPLHATFQNCIITGDRNLVPDEIETDKNSSQAFTVSLENCLYESPTENVNISYMNCLQNVDPVFLLLGAENDRFDFHLGAASPCIDAGKQNGIARDLDGISRNALPDIGCYEFH